MPKSKLDSLFADLSFSDIFETFEDEYLINLIKEDPKQLERICVFLSLDIQLMKEKHQTLPKEKLN
tara:strand:- start:260 stop:457 length:198 start_codon:yes stop_codon:yes gene_type:complete